MESIIQNLPTFVLLALFVLFFYLQDFSSRDVVFSLQLAIVFDLGLCGGFCRSPLDDKWQRLQLLIL